MASTVFGELMGTMVLILMGKGSVASRLLPGRKAEGTGWLAITAGWWCPMWAAAGTVCVVSRCGSLAGGHGGVGDRSLAGRHDGVCDQAGAGSGSADHARDSADTEERREQLGLRSGAGDRAAGGRGGGGIVGEDGGFLGS